VPKIFAQREVNEKRMREPQEHFLLSLLRSASLLIKDLFEPQRTQRKNIRSFQLSVWSWIVLFVDLYPRPIS